MNKSKKIQFTSSKNNIQLNELKSFMFTELKTLLNNLNILKFHKY